MIEGIKGTKMQGKYNRRVRYPPRLLGIKGTKMQGKYNKKKKVKVHKTIHAAPQNYVELVTE